MVTTKKKSPAKKTRATRKKTTSKKSTAAAMRSFHPAVQSAPFMTFKITRQTIYWLIIAATVLVLGAWVVRLQTDVQRIYDQIQTNNAIANSLEIKQTAKNQ